MNCWEWKLCGREAGGRNAAKNGVCPAYPDHGKHCARVAGTLCEEKVQGTYAAKLANCMRCGFYRSRHYDKEYDAIH